MQCVIICAGKGTRMRPLTNTTPKPLLEVCGKPVLQHVVEALPSEIDEIVLVVGYLQEQIREVCGQEYLGRAVTYVEQSNFSGGTGDALLCTKDIVSGTFLFMYADDIHGAPALAEAVKKDHAILSTTCDHPEDFGVIEQNEDGSLKGIIEKPSNPPSNLINIGGFVLNSSIFDYSIAADIDSGEIYATDYITAYAADNKIEVIQQNVWIPVGRPEDIAKAEQKLCPIKDIDSEA